MDSIKCDLIECSISGVELIKENLTEIAVNADDILVFQQGIDALTEWGACYFLNSLKQKHLFQHDDVIHDIDELMYHLNALPKYKRFLDSVLEILSRRGYLKSLAQGIYELANSESIKSDGSEQEFFDILAKYPGIEGSAHFLKSVLDNCFEVLTGERKFLNILFPSGGFDVVESLYKSTPDAAYFNQLAAKVVGLYAKAYHNKNAEKVSILEIGAGIGSTTEYILPILKANQLCSEYCYTDISRAFLHRAKCSLGGRYDFMSFSLLNIEKIEDVEKLNKKYDIIVATNVLHATKCMQETLKNMRSILKPNGVFVLNEGVLKIDLSTLTYGLTDGWWLFEDMQWRIPGSPFIHLENWKKLFSISGFKQVASMNELIKPNIQVVQDVIVVQ